MGRDVDLDRDPLQTSHFAATKGLTAQTLAPDDAQGRSRQVKAGRGQVESSQVEPSQVEAGSAESCRMKSSRVKSRRDKPNEIERP